MSVRNDVDLGLRVLKPERINDFEHSIKMHKTSCAEIGFLGDFVQLNFAVRASQCSSRVSDYHFSAPKEALHLL